MVRTMGLILAASLILIGCQNGKDGQDGHVYARPTWTNDVNAADFSQVGVTAPTIVYGEKYQLTPGTGTIYWRSNTTWYSAVVTVDPAVNGGKGKAGTIPFVPGENGNDGQDRVYRVFFSGSSMTVTADDLVPIGAGSAPLPSVQPADTASATEGVFIMKQD